MLACIYVHASMNACTIICESMLACMYVHACWHASMCMHVCMHNVHARACMLAYLLPLHLNDEVQHIGVDHVVAIQLTARFVHSCHQEAAQATSG